ncbi:MAG TPA: large conductance mechanosensitive channel protein MscL [Acidimicrobiales bacterium]
MAERKKSIFTEFKEFLLRGNVVDLAVAVVIGVAFGTVVAALVKDLLTPIIAAIFGEPNFANLTFSIHKSNFLYGDFINAVIAFVSIAAAIFFFVVKPVNYLLERRQKGQADPESSDRPCPECLSTIPKAATRCAYCTAQVSPVA